MNIADLTNKYIDLIPKIEDGPQIEEEISQIEQIINLFLLEFYFTKIHLSYSFD